MNEKGLYWTNQCCKRAERCWKAVEFKKKKRKLVAFKSNISSQSYSKSDVERTNSSFLLNLKLVCFVEKWEYAILWKNCNALF